MVPSPWNPEAARGRGVRGLCGGTSLRHDDLINNYRFSVSQFEPKSRRWGGGGVAAFSVCASWSSRLFRSESVSGSPEGARHGTATGPARAERNAWWEEKKRGRREGGVEERRCVWGVGRGGVDLDRIRSPVSAVATTGGLFAREHIGAGLLRSVPEPRLDQRQQRQVEPPERRMLPPGCCLTSSE